MRFVFLFLLFLVACASLTTTPNFACQSGVYANSECCAYVCEMDCPNGYADNTCNCACKSEDLGLDGFEAKDLEPPGVPH